MKFLARSAVLVLLAALAPLGAHACTSWMVFSDLTKNNTNILHKNRDIKWRRIGVYLSDKKSKFKWVALGNDGNTNMGINSAGLAVVMNSGEKCIEPPNDKTKKSTPALLKEFVSSCGSAAQAVEKLQQYVKAGNYYHGESGSIFFFCDTQEGYVCEITAKTCSVQRYDHSYTVRANIWQNPDMYALSRNYLARYINSSGRVYCAISELNSALDKNHKITVSDIFALSRQCQMPKDSPTKRAVCNKSTNSSATLEIDRQYPDVLSTMYAAIGSPRNTVYVPVPVCTVKLHPAMSDLRWSGASWKRFDKLGFSAPIPEEWSAFEKRAMAKYTAARDQARKLLDAGKRDKAIKLINDTAASIWDEAVKLLKL